MNKSLSVSGEYPSVVTETETQLLLLKSIAEIHMSEHGSEVHSSENVGLISSANSDEDDNLEIISNISEDETLLNILHNESTGSSPEPENPWPKTDCDDVLANSSMVEESTCETLDLQLSGSNLPIDDGVAPLFQTPTSIPKGNIVVPELLAVASPVPSQPLILHGEDDADLVEMEEPTSGLISGEVMAERDYEWYSQYFNLKPLSISIKKLEKVRINAIIKNGRRRQKRREERTSEIKSAKATTKKPVKKLKSSSSSTSSKKQKLEKTASSKSTEASDVSSISSDSNDEDNSSSDTDVLSKIKNQKVQRKSDIFIPGSLSSASMTKSIDDDSIDKEPEKPKIKTIKSPSEIRKNTKKSDDHVDQGKKAKKKQTSDKHREKSTSAMRLTKNKTVLKEHKPAPSTTTSKAMVTGSGPIFDSDTEDNLVLSSSSFLSVTTANALQVLEKDEEAESIPASPASPLCQPSPQPPDDETVIDFSSIAAKQPSNEEELKSTLCRPFQIMVPRMTSESVAAYRSLLRKQRHEAKEINRSQKFTKAIETVTRQREESVKEKHRKSNSDGTLDDDQLKKKLTKASDLNKVPPSLREKMQSSHRNGSKVSKPSSSTQAQRPPSDAVLDNEQKTVSFDTVSHSAVYKSQLATHSKATGPLLDDIMQGMTQTHSSTNFKIKKVDEKETPSESRRSAASDRWTGKPKSVEPPGSRTTGGSSNRSNWPAGGSGSISSQYISPLNRSDEQYRRYGESHSRSNPRQVWDSRNRIEPVVSHNRVSIDAIDAPPSPNDMDIDDDHPQQSVPAPKGDLAYKTTAATADAGDQVPTWITNILQEVVKNKTTKTDDRDNDRSTSSERDPANSEPLSLMSSGPMYDLQQHRAGPSSEADRQALGTLKSANGYSNRPPSMGGNPGYNPLPAPAFLSGISASSSSGAYNGLPSFPLVGPFDSNASVAPQYSTNTNLNAPYSPDQSPLPLYGRNAASTSSSMSDQQAGGGPVSTTPSAGISTNDHMSNVELIAALGLNANLLPNEMAMVNELTQEQLMGLIETIKAEQMPSTSDEVKEQQPRPHLQDPRQAPPPPPPPQQSNIPIVGLGHDFSKLASPPPVVAAEPSPPREGDYTPSQMIEILVMLLDDSASIFHRDEDRKRKAQDVLQLLMELQTKIGTGEVTEVPDGFSNEIKMFIAESLEASLQG